MRMKRSEADSPLRKVRWVGASGLVPLALAVLSVACSSSSPELDAALYRIDPGQPRQPSQDERLSSGAAVGPGDRLYMTVRVTDPLHVYVFHESESGATTPLFPLAGLDADEPLESGRTHRLPGPWHVAGSVGTIHVVASRDALDVRASDRSRGLRGIGGFSQAGQETPDRNAVRRWSIDLSRAVEESKPASAPVPAPRCDDAEEAAEAELLAAEQAHGPASVQWAQAATGVVESMLPCREPGDPVSLQLAQQAVTVRERLSPDDPGACPALHNLARLHCQDERHEDARTLLARRIAILRRHAPDGVALAAALRDLGECHYWPDGDFAPARRYYEEAVAIYRRHDSRTPQAAHALTNLGQTLRYLGDLDGARSVYEEALSIWSDEEANADTAVTYNSYAGLLQELGEHREARRYFELALAQWTDPRKRAYVRNNLASLLVEMRNFADAQRHYEAALQTMRQHGDPQESTVLKNLARLYHLWGDLERSGELYEQVLAILEQGAERGKLAATHEKYADLLTELGETARAEGYYRSAEETWRSFGARAHLAVTLSGLARLYARTSRPELALQTYDGVVELREQDLGADHPLVGDALYRRAGQKARTGAAREALDDALRAVETLQRHVRLTMPALAEREALRYAPVATEALDLAIGLAVDAPAFVDAVWDAQIRARALVLDEMAARHRGAHGNGNETVRRRRDALAAATKECSYLLLRGPGDPDPERFPEELADCRARVEQLERRLARESETFAADYRLRDAGLARIRKALPAGAALVAFRLYADPDTPGARRYAAFVLPSADAEPRLIPLGSEEQINERIRTGSPEELLDSDLDSLEEAERDYRARAVELRRSIWDPLVPLLPANGTVFVVPDGAISLVSLASLPVAETGYLVESGVRLHYLSAERDLIRSGEPAARGDGLLAIGGVDFGPFAPPRRTIGGTPPVAAQDCVDFAGERFLPLEATLREVEELESIWRAGNGSEALVLTATRADEAALKAQVPGRRVVHFATHGFFLDNTCHSLLGGAAGADPLRLSGLVLGEANLRADRGPEEEDGILTAAEIAALDLTGVEWAVLSACETGRGKLQAGEGVLGLQRAFRIAGADTVIMSLWEVSDVATLDWMIELYRGRMNGLATAEATQEASRKVLAQRRLKGKSTHPFFWAGFVATGDWR